MPQSTAKPINIQQITPNQEWAKNSLESFLWKRRRTTYYLAKVAHEFDIPYWRIFSITKEDITFNKEKNKFIVHIKDAQKVLIKVIERTPMQMHPLFKWMSQSQSKMIKEKFVHLTLIRLSCDKLAIAYCPVQKKILGFWKAK